MIEKMDKEMNSTVNSLLKTDHCSPLIIYFILVVVSVITLFNTHGLTKTLKNFKVNNIFNIHVWYEISYLVLLGVVLYGLCKYNQETLAWIILFLPLVTYLVKTVLIFTSVSSVLKQVPPPNGEDPKQVKNSNALIQQGANVNNTLQTRQDTLNTQNSNMINNLNNTGMSPPLNSNMNSNMNSNQLSGFSF